MNGWSDNYYDNRTYNELHQMQLAALDPALRQQYAHDAQRVHYRSAPFIILVYPFFHYAWWTDEYEGWGDMNAHPGRQINHFWGGHPLLLSLQPTGTDLGGPTGFTPLQIGLVTGAAAGVAVALIALMLKRRKRRTEEEMPLAPPPPPSG